MPETYSTYEAKAKFSEILRRVRAGETVRVSYRGEEVAEIRPVEKSKSVEERIRELEEQGILTRPKKPRGPLQPIAKRPGALKRFLDSRD